MPCDATSGIWGNGFFNAAKYSTPPNTETGYTYNTKYSMSVVQILITDSV